MSNQTLRNLHEKLGVKQTLKIYVNNTNKKYGSNWTADTELNLLDYTLVEFNTLGKHRKHSKQAQMLEKLLVESAFNNDISAENKQLREANQTAQQIVADDNLKNSYIETLQIYIKWQKARLSWTGDDKHKVINEIAGLGLKYAQYISDEGIDVFFNQRLKWFKSKLK